MRTRLPVKLKLAVVTAALTFGILCLFAVVIGAVAEQRIRAGFDDDLRATVADIVNSLDVRLTPSGVRYDEEALTGRGHRRRPGGPAVRYGRGDLSAPACSRSRPGTRGSATRATCA